MKLDCENNYCETQAAKGRCNKGWMKLRCKKACGLCKYNITLKPIFHDLGTYLFALFRELYIVCHSISG